MGQAAHVAQDVALDTVITNALILDAVTGIIKADVGIKVYSGSPLSATWRSILSLMTFLFLISNIYRLGHILFNRPGTTRICDV